MKGGKNIDSPACDLVELHSKTNDVVYITKVVPVVYWPGL